MIGALALTLGASTAVFSLVNGVLLEPLPYPCPEPLVSIREIVPQWANQYPTVPANARHFEEWRRRATSFAAMAALDWRTMNVSGTGDPFQATILRASGTLFDVLRLPVAMAHTTLGVTATIRELRADIRAVDPEVAIGNAAPLHQVVDTAVARRRYQASLFIAFAGVALLIATIGVYATTAYGVSRRRREMNIRVALGAPVASVFALVLRQTAVPLVVGVAVGSAGALALGTAVATLLFEVRPRDPIVLATAVLIVSAAGMLAAVTAARQGMRIDPVAALRAD